MIETLFVVAFAVIGSIEWLKALIDGIESKKWPELWPSLVVASAAVGAGTVLGLGDILKSIGYSFVALSAIELGYQFVVKGIMGWVIAQAQTVRDWIGSKFPKPKA